MSRRTGGAILHDAEGLCCSGAVQGSAECRELHRHKELRNMGSISPSCVVPKAFGQGGIPTGMWGRGLRCAARPQCAALLPPGSCYKWLMIPIHLLSPHLFTLRTFTFKYVFLQKLYRKATLDQKKKKKKWFKMHFSCCFILYRFCFPHFFPIKGRFSNTFFRNKGVSSSALLTQ